MREIKFREWHQNHMRYWDDIGSFHLYVLNDGKGVFEQYTGLKDKNGVEIFEGDILVETKIDWFVGVVNYANGCYWCDYERLSDCTDCYIAGNIHENPELLEDE